MLGVESRSSVHIGYKKKYILIPGKGPTQGLDYTTQFIFQDQVENFA